MTMGFVVAAVVSFLAAALSGKGFVPLLRKLKAGQTIKEIGPNWHKSKEGTPTMGGVIFIVGMTAGLVAGVVALLASRLEPESDFLWDAPYVMRLLGGFLMALAYGFVGFVDDYIKVVKKQNLGLRAKQKLLLQIFVAAAYLLSMEFAGALSTVITVPFLGQFDFGIFYYPFSMFVIVGTVNAVNLTDGIDGLAASVTFAASAGFLVITGLLNAYGLSVFAASLCGALLGFLLYNFHPAKVFMGDTGSLFLGGAVAALAFGLNLPILLVPVGIIYIIEAMSDIIQISYFKLSGGKRVFKMAPIHHHFEMCGWSEMKIVVVFTCISVLGSAFAIYSVFWLLNH